MDWTPTLADRPGPTYQRIVEALSADIAQGRLHRGQKLPTHRALAKALGVDLTIFEPPVPMRGFTIDYLASVARATDPALQWLRDRIFEICSEGGTERDLHVPPPARSAWRGHH